MILIVAIVAGCIAGYAIAEARLRRRAEGAIELGELDEWLARMRQDRDDVALTAVLAERATDRGES